jgi:hypothetical protein
MGAKQISKTKREELLGGHRQPENPKEEAWLANQLAKQRAGGTLPQTYEQVQHDKYYAATRRSMKRDAEPRYVKDSERNYPQRQIHEGRVSSRERPLREGRSDRESQYVLHSRDERPSPPR